MQRHRAPCSDRQRETRASRTERETRTHRRRRRDMWTNGLSRRVVSTVCGSRRENVRTGQSLIPTETRFFPPRQAKTRRTDLSAYITALSLYFAAIHIKDRLNPFFCTSTSSQKIVHENRARATQSSRTEDRVLSGRIMLVDLRLYAVRLCHVIDKRFSIAQCLLGRIVSAGSIVV